MKSIKSNLEHNSFAYSAIEITNENDRNLNYNSDVTEETVKNITLDNCISTSHGAANKRKIEEIVDILPIKNKKSCLQNSASNVINHLTNDFEENNEFTCEFHTGPTRISITKKSVHSPYVSPSKVPTNYTNNNNSNSLHTMCNKEASISVVHDTNDQHDSYEGQPHVDLCKEINFPQPNLYLNDSSFELHSIIESSSYSENHDSNGNGDSEGSNNSMFSENLIWQLQNDELLANSLQLEVFGEHYGRRTRSSTSNQRSLPDIGLQQEGLYECEIECLPTRVFKFNPKVVLEKGQNSEYGYCTVCLKEFEDKELLCYLPCFHEFHVLCIHTWLKKSKICPFCRMTVFSY